MVRRFIGFRYEITAQQLYEEGVYRFSLLKSRSSAL